MKHDCSKGCAKCVDLTRAEHQPFGVEVFSADNVFVKQMIIPKAGTYVPQHAHKYDHLTMLAAGSIRVWKDGILQGDRSAPTGIEIPAGVKHMFMSLEDGTVAYCIHNLSRPDFAAVVEEHQIVEAA